MFEAKQVSRATGFPFANNYIITNLGPAVAFVGHGPDSGTAIANASVPTEATSQFCFVVPPGQRSVEAKENAFFAAVTASGTADILITPGHGLVDGFGEGLANLDTQGSAASVAMLDYLIGSQQDLMRGLLIELRTITEFVKQGLNVAEDPDAVRSDQVANIQ